MVLSRREILGLGLAAIPAAVLSGNAFAQSTPTTSGAAAGSTKALDLTVQMVAIPSYSHISSKPIADFTEAVLKNLGFETERIEYTDTRKDPKGVLKVNILGKKGQGTGGFALSGHLDTVPADTWKEGDPCKAVTRDGKLYGRGVCDMKGPLGCMMEASSRYSAKDLKKPLYFVLASDEEIVGGAKEIVNKSQIFKEMVAGNIPTVIGEPTLMDVVYSHKTGWSFTVTARGEAGHTSRDIGFNANLKLIPFLAEMKKMHTEVTTDAKWLNTEYDPPHIVWNIRMNDGPQPSNIYPPTSTCTVTCRIMPKVDVPALADRVKALAESMGLEITMGNPKPAFYYVDPGSDFIRKLLSINGKMKAQTAPYGTDAGTYFAGGTKLLAISGPGNIDQAHTDDEWIDLAQLDTGVNCYAKMIEAYCL